MRPSLSRTALRQTMDQRAMIRAMIGLRPAGSHVAPPDYRPKPKPKPRPNRALVDANSLLDILASSARGISSSSHASSSSSRPVARPCEALCMPTAPEAAEPESTTRFIVKFREDANPVAAALAVRQMCEATCAAAAEAAAAAAAEAEAAAAPPVARLRSLQPFACRTATVEGVPREALMGCEALAGFEPDRVVRIGALRAQIMPAGVQQIRAPAARSRTPVRPVNADVFVLDTGVARGHRDLNVVSARSFVASEPDPWDRHGHGTAVAGVIGARDNGLDIVGVAPGVRIHSLKVLNRHGDGLLSEVVAAVEHMILWKRAMGRRVRNAVVANLSLGAYVGSADYTVLDEVLRRAVREGITVVVAAGNEAADASLYTPAHLREGIVVGACDVNDRLTGWSNWGAPLTLHAPGEDILTTYLGNRIARISGTSFAAPHAAGAAALFLARNQTASPARVKSELRRMAGARAVPRVDLAGREGTTAMRLDCRTL
jgi:hypothetical protein